MVEERKSELRDEVQLDVEWLNELESKEVTVNCSLDDEECLSCGS